MTGPTQAMAADPRVERGGQIFVMTWPAMEYLVLNTMTEATDHGGNILVLTLLLS